MVLKWTGHQILKYASWVFLTVLFVVIVVVVLSLSHGSTDQGLSSGIRLFWLAPVASIIALLYAGGAAFYVLLQPAGGNEILRVSALIRSGAITYLKQQFRVVTVFFGVMFVLLLIISFGFQLVSPFVPFAFVTGGLFSVLISTLGVWIATLANSRTAWAARKGLNPALRVAFTAGSVQGMALVGVGLLYVSGWFYFLRYIVEMDIMTLTNTMLTFVMGASAHALFARVGGGIFTKSADVSADIVGKIEVGIPEDDPRNPATIADNVGDIVGDGAGMGADLFESYLGSVVATMSLGTVAFPENPLRAIMTPILITAVGVLASLIGNFFVGTRHDITRQSVLLRAIRRGIYLTTFLIIVGGFLIIRLMLGTANLGIFLAMLVGLVNGNIISYFSEVYTSDHYQPVRKLAKQSRTGTATLIISGLANGMLSTWVPVVTIAISVASAYYFAGGAELNVRGLFGIGIAAIGMLTPLGINLSTDAYGPIADNAGGIARMVGEKGGLGEDVRKRTDALDSLGNTTAATGKGHAIGSAAFTALALLAAFRDDLTRVVQVRFAIKDYRLTADLLSPDVLIGLLLGAMIPFVFSALTMNAVGRTANLMIHEIRQQFKDEKILDGDKLPDYQSCISISSKGALREMLFPVLLAVFVPLLVGIFFGMRSLIGLLAGGLLAGTPLSLMMSNSGGAWDNAKKFIEAGNLGGKGSLAHMSAVVSDTVGDPFKDVSGPSLNILIKLMIMVSIVFGSTLFLLNRTVGLFH